MLFEALSPIEKTAIKSFYSSNILICITQSRKTNVPIISYEEFILNIFVEKIPKIFEVIVSIKNNKKKK